MDESAVVVETEKTDMSLETSYTYKERRRYLEKVHPKLASCYDIFMCIIVRLILLIEGVICIYYLVSSSGMNYTYLALVVLLVFICADAVVVIVRRNGKEWFWLSISSICYTFILLLTIWTIVLSKFDAEDFDCSENNTAIGQQEYWVYDYLELCNLLEIIVDVFILTCILTRWLLPTKKKFKREALMSLLLSFITNGTDIIEFFTYVDEERIFVNKSLVLWILIMFSISTLQFSFTLSAKINRVNHLQRSFSTALIEVVLGTELWAIAVVFLSQDFPFMIIRTYVIVYYGAEKNYLLYFFVVKNYVLCIFEIYAVLHILLDERHMRKQQREDIQLTAEF